MGECWGRKAVDGVQVTGGLPSNGMPAGAFRPAHGSCRRGGSRSLPANAAWCGCRRGYPLGHSGKWPCSSPQHSGRDRVSGRPRPDGEVGGVVPPGTLYPGIGGLGGIQQRKHPMYPGFIAKNPADALSDIGADQLRRRIGAAPLGGISGLQHIFLRRAIDGHKLRLIGGSGSADGQHGGLLSWWRYTSVIRRV